MEWAVLSLRGGAPFAAGAVLLGSRFRSLGPSLALGFAAWMGLLVTLAVLVACLGILGIRFR